MNIAGEKWLKKVISKKGDWFDYSLVRYTKAKNKVRIRCKTCGNVFEQAPDSHIRKPKHKGCPYCAGKKYTTKIIQGKIKEIYNDKYDVSKVVFTKTSNKVIVGCKVHGDFQTTVNNLLRGVAGCKKCSDTANGKACRMTIPEFLLKANVKFDNKYSYPDVVFESLDDKINIICPVHGCFTVTARKHLNSTTGCPACGRDSITKHQIGTTEDFLTKGKIVHNKYYTYDKVRYQGSNTKVIITCPVHGDFEQVPNAHLNGSGCKKCGIIRRTKKITSSLKELEQKLLDKYSNSVYDYSKAVYINACTPLTVTCKFCGKDITSSPSKLQERIFSCSCVSDRNYTGGFKPYLPGILYYLRVEHEGFTAYKIGITNRSVVNRYRSTDRKKITVIKEWNYANGKDARAAETKILQDFKVYQWVGVDLLRNGNTELFDRDILELDKKESSE